MERVGLFQLLFEVSIHVFEVFTAGHAVQSIHSYSHWQHRCQSFDWHDTGAFVTQIVGPIDEEPILRQTKLSCELVREEAYA